MAQYFENFSGFSPGTTTGLGFTKRIFTGGEITVIDEDVTHGKFLNLSKSNSSSSYVASWDVLNGAQDVELLLKFRINGGSPTSGRYGILYGRYDGTSEATTRGYAASFTPASNVPSVILYEDSIGTVGFGNFSWASDTVYWARLRVVGNTQKFRIWAHGSAEPSTWLVESNHTGPSIANPYSGIGTFTAWGSMHVFQISAGTNGEAALYGANQDKVQSGKFNIVKMSEPTQIGGITGGWGTFNFGNFHGGKVSGISSVDQDRSQPGVFRLKKFFSKAQVGQFRVTATESKNQVGVFRLKKFFSRTQSGVFRIDTNPLRVQQGIFRVRKYFSKSQGGKFRVSLLVERTQSGNFWVRKENTEEQTGVFRVQNTLGHDQSGHFRIHAEMDRTLAGRFRVSQVVEHTQVGSFITRLTNITDITGSFFVENRFLKAGGLYIPDHTIKGQIDPDALPDSGLYIPQYDTEGSFEQTTIETGLLQQNTINKGKF